MKPEFRPAPFFIAFALSFAAVQIAMRLLFQ